MNVLLRWRDYWTSHGATDGPLGQSQLIGLNTLCLRVFATVGPSSASHLRTQVNAVLDEVVVSEDNLLIAICICSTEAPAVHSTVEAGSSRVGKPLGDGSK